MFQNTKNLNIFAGAAFALLALSSLGSAFATESFSQLLTLFLYVLFAVTLFCGKRNFLLPLGFLALTLLSFFYLVRYISYGAPAFALLQELLTLLSCAAITFISLALATSLLSEGAELARRIFFVPAALVLLNYFLTLVGSILTRFTSMGLWYFDSVTLVTSLLSCLLSAAALFLTAAWLCGGAAQEDASEHGGNTEDAYYHCGLVKHILLLLFTFRVWEYIWIYRVTRYTNRDKSTAEWNGGSQLLLCMFVPFYSLYWTYKCARRIDNISRQNGLGSDLAVLCLILAIFIGIVPPILMQEQINTILGVQRGTVRVKNAAPRAESAAGADRVAQELQTYKELLDKGLITQEEYEAKKRQLLGL